MLESLAEVRYPWDSALDFFAGGYWLEIGSLHIFFGWLFLIWLVCCLARNGKTPVEFRLATLYFSLTIFTNFAYNLYGLNVNELFGVLAVFFVIIRGYFRCSRVVKFLLLVFLVSFIHSIVVAVFYPELLPNLSIAVVKFAIIGKVLVLAINLGIVGHSISRGLGLEQLIKSCVFAGVFALLMYLLQFVIFFSGIQPYGTFIDAGFVGVPSFGSVSIERGHMGKFIVSYFPFFLYAFMKWKWRWRFILFIFVSTINVSASGLVFFAFALMLAFLIYRNLIGIKGYSLIVLTVAGLIALLTVYWPVFLGVVDKIVTIAIQGDESQGGGRSFGLFLEYITTYPYGMGYSGSTLRTAPDLAEINAAHYAFLSQYSFLALPLILGFILLLINVYRFGRSRGGELERCMLVGVLLAPVIFFVDILWFVPLIWLPFEIVLSSRLQISKVRNDAWGGSP